MSFRRSWLDPLGLGARMAVTADGLPTTRCECGSCLSPGLDTSFLATFTAELGALAAADEATAQLISELRQRLAPPVQSSL